MPGQHKNRAPIIYVYALCTYVPSLIRLSSKGCPCYYHPANSRVDGAIPHIAASRYTKLSLCLRFFPSMCISRSFQLCPVHITFLLSKPYSQSNFCLTYLSPLSFVVGVLLPHPLSPPLPPPLPPLPVSGRMCTVVSGVYLSYQPFSFSDPPRP